MVFAIGEPVRLAEKTRSALIARMAVFGLFCLAGATVLGSLLGWIGAAWLPSRSIAVWTAVAAFAAFAVVRESVAPQLPIPQRRWQLPRAWTRSFWGSAAVYGGAMGMGVFTLTPSALFYVYLLGCLLAQSVWLGASIGLWYGIWFFAAVIYATVRWRDSAAGEQATHALRVLRGARMVGAPLSLLLVALPNVWPY